MITPLTATQVFETQLAPPSPEEVVQQVQGMAEDLWRATPATMAYKLTEGQWRPAQHLLEISAEVASAITNALEYGQPGSVIVTIPPRHGKSELISVHTPMWIFDRWPNARIMLIGYGSDLAEGFSRRVRDASEDPSIAPLLRYHIRKDVRSVSEWGTEEGGMLYAMGIGGAITGRGANVLIIDDYIKNALEALSPAYNESIYNWFVSTALTRLEPNACIIVVATRWGKDDLIGRIIADAARPWKVINLSAVAGKSDPIGRPEGFPLWAARYSIDALTAIKKALGKYWWAALYDQKPIDQGTNRYRDNEIQKVQIIKNREYLITGRGWDMAATPKPVTDGQLQVKKKKDPDWTVGFKWGIDLEVGMWYMLDCIWVQVGAGDFEILLRATAEIDGADCMIFPEIEPGSSGKNYISHLQRNVLKGFSVHGVPTSGPKLFRANPFLSAIEQGAVRMLEGDWNDRFESELSIFPTEKRGVKDDAVDAAGNGFNGIVERLRRRGVVWGKTAISEGKIKEIRQVMKGKLISGAAWGRG